MSKSSSNYKRKLRGLKQETGKKHCSSSSENSTEVKDKLILASNGYSIGRKIDSGTFAVVRYAEKNTRHGTVPLAVKIINKAKASPMFTQKFLHRELEIWPKLRHRHIIQVEKMIQIQDRIYIFMELAPGGSVIDYLHNHGAVDEDLARMWCKRMCQALRYCHKKGIAHRDLKCDNLLLDNNLQIKIGDFGFSCKCINPYTGMLIYSQTYCGSSSYVAPEVIEGKPYDPIAADLWSAGVCIYVILNNLMPFDDSNIVTMHNDQVTRHWNIANDRLSEPAKRLLRRLLEPDAALRPSTDQVLNSSWMRIR